MVSLLSRDALEMLMWLGVPSFLSFVQKYYSIIGPDRQKTSFKIIDCELWILMLKLFGGYQEVIITYWVSIV